MTPYVLMLALSVHSIFEGLAVGINDNESEVLNMAIAIVIHKGAASCSLGISLLKTFPNDFGLIRWLIFIFACATPLGVFIGMLLASQGELMDIIFSSLAAGTFVYIAASEIIVGEFSVGGYRWLKFLFFILGALIITLLWFLE